MGDVLELAAGSTLQGVFSAQAWPGPFGIEYDHPSYVQVEFNCTGPDRPFIYRGVLRPADFLFVDAERASTSRPDEPPVESVDTIADLFDYRIDITPVIDGWMNRIRVRLMSSYFTIHLCPTRVLIFCRFFDLVNGADFREIWYDRPYESILFTNAP